MVIAGLLIVIVAILLFGAGAVRGALMAVFNGVLLLVGVGVLAYGLEWDGRTIAIVIGVVAALAVWMIWEFKRQ